MLALDDIRWASLTHPFGSAADVPELLRRLAAAKPLPASSREEPLSSLWDRVCHQAIPDQAAFAAVPHLVEIARQAPPTERPAVLHLVGAVAAYESCRSTVPPDLRVAYNEALERAQPVLHEALWSHRNDEIAVLILLADIAGVQGHRQLARVVMELESGELELRCECKERLQRLGLGSTRLETELEWVDKDPTDEGDAPERELAGHAQRLGQTTVAAWIADLGRSVRCPGCGSSIALLTHAITH